MIEHSISIRVRYAETDAMNFVYYGNYATYFEVARVELMRHLGLSYRAIEEMGIWMPVVDFHIHYFKPAQYDDEVVIKVKVLIFLIASERENISKVQIEITFH